MPQLTERDRQAEAELLLRLQTLRIADADQLLRVCRTGADRYGLSLVLRVDTRDIDSLVNRVDLARVEGLDDQAIELLARAGISTLQALARCSSDWLCAQLESLSGGVQMPSQPPVPETVRGWVSLARQLPRRVWD